MVPFVAACRRLIGVGIMSMLQTWYLLIISDIALQIMIGTLLMTMLEHRYIIVLSPQHLRHR